MLLNTRYLFSFLVVSLLVCAAFWSFASSKQTSPLYTQPKPYSPTQLEKLYVLSRQHNTCQAELQSIDTSNTSLRKSVNDVLNQQNDSKQWPLALMHTHTLGIIDVQQTTLLMQQNQLRRTKRDYDQFRPTGFNEKPSENQIEMMRTFFNIRAAMESGNIADVTTLTSKFNEISDSKGLVTRVRGQPVLAMPSVAIGHHLVGMPIDQADALIATIDVTPTMLSQAIRSGGDVVLINRLLTAMTSAEAFTNKPILTKDSKLQTPLQAAIQVKNIEVLRLLLDQKTLSYDRYSQSPVNSLLFQSINKNSSTPNLDIQDIAILELLRDYNYRAELTPNKQLKQMKLIGYPIFALPPSIIKQLEEIELAPRIVTQLYTPSAHLLDADTKDKFDQIAIDIEAGKVTYQNKQQACTSISKEWKEARPKQIIITDIKPYLKAGLSNAQQINHLALTSPVLVDSYYAYSLKRIVNPKAIDAFVHSIDSVEIDLRSYSSVIHNMDLSLNEQHYLMQKLCEKFDERGVYAGFEFSRFINFSDLDDNNCLLELPTFYSDIKPDFFRHSATYPSEVYYMLSTFALSEALMLLQEKNDFSTQRLAGFPHGRDALMIALDRKNMSVSNSPLFDFYNIIKELIAVTDLNYEHMQRLHRLKVVDILMFEQLAVKFPHINNATQYPFDVYAVLF